MNLHRANKQAEWQTVPPASRNYWQRLGARTHSVITPGNLCTLAGLGLVFFGSGLILHKQFALSLMAVILGRLLDIADGWLADHTGTKSPLGEAFDATADKIGGLAVIATMVMASILPWWAAIAILLPHILTSLLAAYAVAHGHRLHPSRLGKVAMAIGWIALFGFIFAAWISTGMHPLIYNCSILAAVIGCLLGGYATYGYSRRNS